MTSNERGYATLSVSIVLSAIAIITITFLNLSSSRAELESTVLQQLQVDAMLEGAVNKAIADLVHRNLSLGDLESGIEISFARNRFTVIAEHEGAKHNLNVVDDAIMEYEISSLGFPPLMQRSVLQTLRDERSRSETNLLSFNTLRAAITDPSVVNCIRTRFTVFHSYRPLTTSVREGRDGLDGTYLRIRAEEVSQTRGLDTTVLVTGDPTDPVWTVDFHRYHPSEFKECNRATTD